MTEYTGAPTLNQCKPTPPLLELPRVSNTNEGIKKGGQGVLAK